MNTEIVSFYSDIEGKTYYSDHAKRLSENCKSLNIPHDIRHLESKGNYRLNCLSKPKFIRELLLEKEKPFVWMDVDSVIHNELTIYDDKEKVCDVIFAYQSLTPALHINNPKASPIYLNYNQKILEFMNYWVERCEENSKNSKFKVFDHEILLNEVLPVYMKTLRIGVLPLNYAIWPGTEIPSNMKPMITMGIADNTSKEQSLREMGMKEKDINFNLLRH